MGFDTGTRGRGGEEVACGWLTDKYGLSRQIVPAALSQLLQDKDSAKSQRVMKALMRMKRLVIKDLEQA
jgi:predicted 3-demethylubiquinone-9 3-methyltransferase (glyoxalase superfamily)